jgi:hypothetical protein
MRPHGAKIAVRHFLGGTFIGLLIAAGVPALIGCTVVVPLGNPIAGDAGVDAARQVNADAAGPDMRRRFQDADPPQTDDGGGPVCWELQVPRFLAPPQAIIAFDRSETMGPRIELIRAKLMPQLTDLSRAVEIGFLEFPERSCDGLSCCLASSVMVEPALNTSMAIDKLLECNPAGGPCLKPGAQRTPTDDALRRAQAFWEHAERQADRFVVVITDGPPNCDGNIDGPCGKARSVADELERKLSIKTAILGISSLTVTNTCLSRVAVTGGDVFPHGTQARLPFVWIDDVTDAKVLTAALNEVLNPVRERTCVVRLAGPRDQVADVTVMVKGARVPYDSARSKGWNFEPPPTRFSRPTEIRIWGEKCDQILSGEIKAKDVQTLVTCKDCGGGADCR